MVFLAALQIFFMVFILSISGYTSKTSKINTLALRLRQNTALIERTHGFLRSYSIPLSIVVIVLFTFGFWKQQQLSTYLPKPLPGLQVFYKGLHQSANAGSALLQQNISIAEERNDIAIISFEIPWGEGENNKLDLASLQKVYSLNAIPLLLLNAWQKDSASAVAKDTAVVRHIREGKYDTILLSFATQIAQLDKPIFLQFSTAAVQNKFPLLAYDNSRPEDFIASWRYVHQLFNKAGAAKVIWIWTPRNTTSVNTFFPGKNYVDWLGINLAEINTIANNYSFDTIYRPFHEMPFLKAGLPVIITAAPEYAVNNKKWWNEAWQTIDTAFTEIKSVMVAATDNKLRQLGNNLPAREAINNVMANAPIGSMANNLQVGILPKAIKENQLYQLPVNTKNIIYDKGFYWFRNRHTLNLKTLEADVAAMKQLGINTVERTMPGFYDKNLSKVLIANGINLIPRFSLLGNPEMVADEALMKRTKNKILTVIKNNLSTKNIIAWNLGSDVLFSLANQTYKPDFFYYQQIYVKWLADVCSQIRLLDTVRPIIIDLHWDMNGRNRFRYYKAHVPQINCYMLEADVKYVECLKEPLEEGMAWGAVPVELWPLIPAINKSGTIPAWQDIENTDFITLDGLVDMQGRKKESYNKVATAWSNQPANKSAIPDIKILRPAKTTYENTQLKYHILYKNGNTQWNLYKESPKDIRFEWYLVRIDQYDNTMFIKKVGDGTYLELDIPMEPQYYKLYIEAIKGQEVKMVNATLNTPLE